MCDDITDGIIIALVVLLISVLVLAFALAFRQPSIDTQEKNQNIECTKGCEEKYNATFIKTTETDEAYECWCQKDGSPLRIW